MAIRKTGDRAPTISPDPAGPTESLIQTIAAQRKLLDTLSARLEAVESHQHLLDQLMSEVQEQLPRLEADLRASMRDLEDAPATRDRLPPSEVAYRQTVRDIQKLIGAALPPAATIIVVGKADASLLKLDGKTVWRCPAAADGLYAGYHLACSTSVIAQVEAQRSKGADYLLIPEISRWWLEHYGEFSRHLDRRYRLVADETGVGTVYALRDRPAFADAWQGLDEALARFRAIHHRDPSILDWSGLNLTARFPERAVFAPPQPTAPLPYLDATVDVVAVSSPDAATIAEADRVARAAVVSFVHAESTEGSISSVTVRWKADESAATQPSVSIVIPCFNHSSRTEACLSALVETLPHTFNGEVIVVDDASTDDTPDMLARWTSRDPRLTVLRQTVNSGFLRSVNQGAKAASGDVLIFLNNDTIPLANWLPPLVATLRDRQDAGAVGGKLIYPDGTLQEAGGLVFRDGSAANFGRGDHNPDLPLYGFVREVDYCSGALLATPRVLFNELGGFSADYEPGYYEDTDYCFALRHRGYRVFFQPASAVIHAEGGTAGLDLSGAVKRFQVVNQQKFATKWQEALKAQPTRPSTLDFNALHGLARRSADSRGAS